MHISLGGVAFKIKKIMSSTDNTVYNIHQMMLDLKAAYRTLNYHIRSTMNQMISIGNFGLLLINAKMETRKTKLLEITLGNTPTE